MVQTVPLTALARDAARKAQDLRNANIVPCVLYGNDVDNVALQCEYSEVRRAYKEAGKSTIVELDAAGKKVPVLFHVLDFDPVSEKITHVDFFAVDMKKEIEASVPLNFVGESMAVKDLGGILQTARDSVTVKCLPTALPQSLEVDISVIEDFEKQVMIGDIALPDGVEITDEDTVVIATVNEPRRVAVTETASEEDAEGSAEGGAEGEEKKDEEGEKKE